MHTALTTGNNVNIEVLHMGEKQHWTNTELEQGIDNKCIRRLYENAAILNCLQNQNTLLNL